jgi:hypothetical protein
MKILAAGKTSSERAALSVARELGLDTGGQCRKGQDYRETVTHNAAEAQATITLTRSRYPTARTTRPIFQAESYALGFAIINNKRAVAGIRRWFRRNRVNVVHITGHVPFTPSMKFLRSLFNTRRGSSG